MLAQFLLAAAVAAAPIQLSPQARAAIAPVLDAIAQERAAQAALPPPNNESEPIERLGRLDQAPRLALGKVDFSQAPPAERDAARQAMAQAIHEVDAANEAALVKLVPTEGWFGSSRYGEDASRAAFEILEHSDKDLQRRFLPAIEDFVAFGDAPGQVYALMYDRVAVSDGRPQRYGSQLHCENGRMAPYPMEDPSSIDERRRSVGLVQSYAIYLAGAQKDAGC
jgi:hypothetical protein